MTEEQIQAMREKADWEYRQALRDQFAMAALTGLLAHYGKIYGSDASEAAYMMADAMLRAREVQP